VGTRYDWNTTYTASEYLGGRNVSVAQGKVVGGSTKLNRMVFDRGAKSDYDGWEALGNEGWDWKSLLPYFKKVGTFAAACANCLQTQNEIFSPPVAEIRDEYNITWDEDAHGYEGYMHSTYSPFIWPTTSKVYTSLHHTPERLTVNREPGRSNTQPEHPDPSRSGQRQCYWWLLHTSQHGPDRVQTFICRGSVL
jgi:choline dehydrogenase-like flavoprotein